MRVSYHAVGPVGGGGAGTPPQLPPGQPRTASSGERIISHAVWGYLMMKFGVGFTTSMIASVNMPHWRSNSPLVIEISKREQSWVTSIGSVVATVVVVTVDVVDDDEVEVVVVA